jgi:hypothetical protein
MPVLNGIFVLFPTEKYLLASDKGRKVNQSAIQIFDLNFAFLEVLKNAFDASQALDPTVHELSAEIITLLEHLTEPLVNLVQVNSELAHVLEPLADLWQERLGFLTRVMLGELERHRFKAWNVPAKVRRRVSL